MTSINPKPLSETAHPRQITAARFSRDGQVLTAVGFDSAVWRWQLTGNDLKPMPDIIGHRGWATALVFHPQQPWLITADSWGLLRCQTFAEDKPVTLWQHDTAHDGWVRQIAVSPDGKHIATCGRDRHLRLWDAATGKLIAHHKTTDDPYAITFTPDSRSLVFGDLRGHLEARDLTLKKSQRSFDASVLYKLDRLQDIAGLRALLFIDGGKTLLASGTTPQNGATPQSIPTIIFFDYATGKLTKTFTHGTNKEGWIHDLVAHPDGSLMAVTSGTPGSGMVFFTQPDAAAPSFIHAKLANCHALALHPDGKRIVVTSTNRDSNGNGKSLAKDGAYKTNSSPLTMFELV